jgi:hypothetical protein
MKGIARRQQDVEDFAFSLTSFFSFLKVFLFFYTKPHQRKLDRYPGAGGWKLSRQ